MTIMLAAVLLGAGMTSCTSPVERRIRKNPEAFARLNEQDQAAVRQGKIREGLDKSAVLLAWGEPARVTEGRRNGHTFERWNYVEVEAVFTQSYGPPYAYHGPGVHGDPYDAAYYARPAVSYVPHDAAFVEFTAGKVSGWGLPKR